MIFTQEAPLTRKWFSGRSCIRSNWNKLGVNFEEGGNQSAQRKPSKSGWDRLKLNPHTTFFVVEVEGVIDVHYASLASQILGWLNGLLFLAVTEGHWTGEGCLNDTFWTKYQSAPAHLTHTVIMISCYSVISQSFTNSTILFIVTLPVVLSR